MDYLRGSLVRRNLAFNPWLRGKLWIETTVLFSRHELSNHGLKEFQARVGRLDLLFFPVGFIFFST